MEPGKDEVENDYLWNGSGEPDPEIQKLEVLLGRYRHDRPSPEFPAIFPQERWTVRLRNMRFFPALVAAAAGVVVAVGVSLVIWMHGHGAPAEGWEVSSLAGAPQIGHRAIRGKETTARLVAGQLLETDNQSRASLQAENIGQVEVEPSSRVRLLAMGELKRIALDHGTIHAFIWAPPGQFVVDTPSAIAVDLGCAYTLHVDDSGAGLLRTTLGWVGFKLDGREAFIPAGAVCATRPKIGPGTPYFEDAAPSFREALAKFDFAGGPTEQKNAELEQILNEARPRDALTVWHLLSRVDASQRGLVYDKLAALVPPPSSVTRDGILQLDSKMLDLWWNELDLGDVSLWR